MAQVVKLNDASKADEVLKSFEDWTYYSKYEDQYLKHSNGEYVVYMSITPTMAQKGYSLDAIKEYIDEAVTL